MTLGQLDFCIFIVVAVLEIKLRAVHMVSKYPTIELCPQPMGRIFKFILILAVLGIEPQALGMLGKYSIPLSYTPSPLWDRFLNEKA